MNVEKWHRPQCCGTSWMSRDLYIAHLDQDHTATQRLAMLVAMSQQLAQQRATAAGLMARTQLLSGRLRDAEAQQRALLAEFDEWQSKAERKLHAFREDL